MVQKRGAAVLSAALIIAILGVPVPAGAEDAFGHPEWRAAREAIHDFGNHIARLEADPYVDDGYKAPVISSARAKIRRLHTGLPIAQWQWIDPCCYTRKPIRIR